jgi:membrane protease YdiL (CAAX protease family)
MHTQPRASLIKRLLARESLPPWRISAGLVFVAAYVAIWIASLSILSILTGEIEGLVPSPRTLALSALLSGIVITVGVIQWARARYGAGWMEPLRLAAPLPRNTLLVIFLIGLGLAWTFDLGGAVLRLKEGQVVPPVLEALRTPDAAGIIVAALVALVVHPAAEALIFGAILYTSLTRVFSDNRAVIVTGAFIYAIFSLLISPLPLTWYALTQPLLMALVMFSVRAYYQSARAVFVMRAAFGVFFIMAALFL